MFFVLNDEIRNYIRNNPIALGVLAGFCRPNTDFDLVKLEEYQEIVNTNYMHICSWGKRPREEYPVGELGDTMHRDQNLMHEFVEYTLENLNYPLLVDTDGAECLPVVDGAALDDVEGVGPAITVLIGSAGASECLYELLVLRPIRLVGAADVRRRVRHVQGLLVTHARA